MRYPNLRYGEPDELRYYALSFGDDKLRVKNLARYLKRDERTVSDWLNGRKKIPWWVPELLRLRDMEYRQWYEVAFNRKLKRLGVVKSATIYKAHCSVDVEEAKRTARNPPYFSLRLDDFDPPPKTPISSSDA